MNYQIQNEQSGMEWAVNQEDYHPFDTPADPEGQALYEALIEELGIELPPSNPEQDMVANATDGVDNDQASFYSQALPRPTTTTFPAASPEKRWTPTVATFWPPTISWASSETWE